LLAVGTGLEFVRGRGKGPPCRPKIVGVVAAMVQ